METMEANVRSSTDQRPSGWRWLPIEDCLAPINGKKKVGQGWSPQCEKEASPSNDKWGVLKTTAIQAGQFLQDENKLLPTKLEPRPQIEVKVGDLLTTCAGPRSRCGVTCLVRDTRPRLMISGKMYRYRADGKVIDAEYLEAYLQTQEAWDAIDRMKTGGSDSGLNLTHERFLQLPIPVAPLPQQRRIVEAIELQLGRLDAAVARLQGAKARLKRYKQAVLKAAVEGRLTEEWREKNPDVIPADEALSSNLTKRRLDWEQAKLKEFGKPPRTNAWKEKYKEPPTIETEELPDLPEGWTWVGLEQVAAAGAHALKAGPFGSALKKEFYVAKGYKVYGQEQVISGDPYFGDYYIDEDRFDSLKACAVKPGDLLISLVGTIGRVLILPADIEPGIINPRLVKISLDTSVILPEYLKAYLESPYAKYLFSLSTHGGTMEILNLGILKELPIPLPPIKEQQMLLQIMDKVSSSDNEVETTLDAQLQQAVRLRQAVLKRAFEGRLG